MKFLAILISFVAVSAAALIACGGSKEPPPPQSETPPSMTAPKSTTAVPQAEIVIANSGYRVPPSVRPGQEVTVVNNDETAHSLTADANNAFDVRISGSGGIATFAAPNVPGVYPFHCKYHAGMTGSLTVQ